MKQNRIRKFQKFLKNEIELKEEEVRFYFKNREQFEKAYNLACSAASATNFGWQPYNWASFATFCKNDEQTFVIKPHADYLQISIKKL
jgi:hypothetical protein